MSRIAAVIKCRLTEQKNEVVAKPMILLLWLPRIAFYAFTSFLLHKWLSSGSESRIGAVLVAVPILVFTLCLLIGYQKLFAAKEDVLLLTTPLSATQFLLIKYAEILLSVLEVVAFLSVPILLSVGETISVTRAMLVFVCLLLNTLLACLLAVPGALLLVRIILLKRRMLLWVLAGLVPALSVTVAFLVTPTLLASGMSIRLPHWLWSHPVPIIAGQAGVLCVATVCSLRYAGMAYLGTRSRLVEGSQRPRHRTTRKAPMTAVLARFHGSSYAILAKDTVMNLRSPMQWLRAILMLGLLSLYPLISGWFNDGTSESTMGMNVSLACLLGFALLGEVVANAFSVELNRIRIMLAAPIPAWKIMMAKLCAYYLPTVVLCEVSVLVLDLASGLPVISIMYSVILTALITVGMVALLVGMGALGAKPDRDSHGGMDEFMAEQVFITNSSSFLVFLLGSVVVGLNTVLVMTPVLLQARGAALGSATLPLTVLLILETNLLVAVLSLSFGSRCLARLRM
jgi:hypothetical protein